MKDISENIKTITDIFCDRMPFNRVLGITRESLDLENASIRFSMQENLIGNSIFKILHGGAISAMIDIEGAFIISLDLVGKLKEQSQQKVLERLRKVGTIDLRIDYLQPGKGDYFIASGCILRAGNKVAVVRTELRNDQQQLIVVGTGTYLVG